MNFSPISWQCLNETGSSDYCYGLWLFIKVNTFSDFIDYLDSAIFNAITEGDAMNFLLLSLFASFLFLYKQLKGNLFINSDYYLLFFCVLFVLLLIGVFNERYINYLPATIIFYLLQDKESH